MRRLVAASILAGALAFSQAASAATGHVSHCRSPYPAYTTSLTTTAPCSVARMVVIESNQELYGRTGYWVGRVWWRYQFINSTYDVMSAIGPQWQHWVVWFHHRPSS
jgi:hypothetical protein